MAFGGRRGTGDKPLMRSAAEGSPAFDFGVGYIVRINSVGLPIATKKKFRWVVYAIDYNLQSIGLARPRQQRGHSVERSLWAMNMSRKGRQVTGTAQIKGTGPQCVHVDWRWRIPQQPTEGRNKRVEWKKIQQQVHILGVQQSLAGRTVDRKTTVLSIHEQ